MLYDPKWGQETKVEPFTPAHVIAWLEQHPMDETYCYINDGRCLIAGYLKYLGYANVHVGAFGYWSSAADESYSSHQAPEWLHRAALDKPWTFGAALERVRQYTW